MLFHNTVLIAKSTFKRLQTNPSFGDLHSFACQTLHIAVHFPAHFKTQCDSDHSAVFSSRYRETSGP